MFKKVLVANRGEVAARICRTLDALGVASVAVYAEADRDSPHVEAAREAVSLGEGGVAQTYLAQAKLLAAARGTAADAVHPGYGFLSENPTFAQALEDAAVAFIGPRPAHIRSFGLKHEARELAAAAGLALLPGSAVLTGVDEARAWAERIGYPVMLKSSAGGGGIGMARCDDAVALDRNFAAVRRLAAAQFGDPRLFVERCVPAPRHVEVQAFGDGAGGVLVLGDRDCSLQRRHQKVVEECPAPNLADAVRARMHSAAKALLESVAYRSAGTVEFLYDADRQTAYFLEVNTRLQVEHGVTELVFGIDLVRWMIELAAGDLPPLDALADDAKATGCAMQARLCAEDPHRGFRPSPGTASVVAFPRRRGVRVDTSLRSGAEIPPLYDSLVAKVMAHAADRDAARRDLRAALGETVVFGVQTNRDYLRQALASAPFAQARHDTGTLATLDYRPRALEVVAGGFHATVQSWPGRRGYWSVGVPPSGPMDDLSFRLGNRLLGNAEGASGLEFALHGPTLRFHTAATVCVTGFCALESGACWEPFAVAAGDVLAIGKVTQGARGYVLVAGGLDVPPTMGSAATFTLGGFGGMNGRALAAGDVLPIAKAAPPGAKALPQTPDWSRRLELRVTMGPHCTDEFLTHDGIRAFLEAEWTVHYHSDRTGVRLIGPRPAWSRSDGGAAGLHPSNIHDNAYAFGAIDFTGDMPVVLGPDGPSLGGFVCPAVVIEADRWKLGQLAAGDKLRLRAVTEAEARRLRREQNGTLAAARGLAAKPSANAKHHIERSVVLEHEDVRARRAGDEALLFEFGPNTLDIELRLRAHAFDAAIKDERPSGVVETTPGIRSLLVRYDSERFSGAGFARRLLPLLESSRGRQVGAVESRIVRLPLSWDDPACREAVERYTASVRADAPWCPDNIEFIRRINGLADRQAVKDIVFNADYLVLGLGDVYLGAPVATPLDPRQRLVTTKYNPARTWTAENSVGIGGAYLCVYGVEGPGGYQFVGRTLQVWSRHRRGRAFDEHWLLRPFDRIRFHEVDAAELAAMREAFPRGRLDIDIETGSFDIEQHRAFVAAHRDDINGVEARRRQAFAKELEDWRARGLLTFEQSATGDGAGRTAPAQSADAPAPFVVSPMAGSIWTVAVQPGQHVAAGETLFVVESMKAEFEVTAPSSGVIDQVLVAKGQTVAAGQPLAL